MFSRGRTVSLLLYIAICSIVILLLRTYSVFVLSVQHACTLNKMSAEHPSENQTDGNSTQTTLHSVTGARPPFFDPAWQLAMNVEFYFQYAVIVIGIIGAAGNAIVLCALVAHNARDVKKRTINLLIINQNSLDLMCCLLLIVSYSVKVSHGSFSGAVGYFLCTIFIAENATYCVLYGSRTVTAETCTYTP